MIILVVFEVPNVDKKGDGFFWEYFTMQISDFHLILLLYCAICFILKLKIMFFLVITDQYGLAEETKLDDSRRPCLKISACLPFQLSSQ